MILKFCKIFEIKRTNKNNIVHNSKYNVSLKEFGQLYKDILKNRLYWEHISDDDRAINILLTMFDSEYDHIDYNKIFYVPHMDKITTLNRLDYYYNTVNWKCAICNDDIEVNIGSSLRHQHLVCDKCISKPGGKFGKKVDERVVKSYIKLSKFMLTKAKEDEKYLKLKLKRNRKS